MRYSTERSTFSFSVATREMARPILKEANSLIRPRPPAQRLGEEGRAAVPLSSADTANPVDIVLLLVRQGDINDCK